VLGTVSHEYFHAWNVKRIQPPAFRPYGYEEENYTDALWFYEGFTSYYGDRILYRAGLTSSLDNPAAIAANWESIPGDRNQSPADASFNAWIHLYRSDESSDNYRSNYYLTGSVIANLVELEIANRTAGAKGLDDLMRYIWEQTRDRGAEFDSEAIRAACEAVAGGSFREFFDRYVFGTEAIPFAEYFRLAGYDLVIDTAATQAQNQRGFLGVSGSESGDGLQIVGVVRGSPAWHAGINYGDIIVSVGGTRVTGSQSFTQAVARHRPGQTVTVVVSRYGQTQSFDVTLAERPVPVYRLEETAQPTEKQLSVRRLWRMEG
jgi:predicted metalloprotease with PDZ domain